jgi:hypothetical protein
LNAAWTCGDVFRRVPGSPSGNFQLFDSTRGVTVVNSSDPDCNQQSVLQPGRYGFSVALLLRSGDLAIDQLSLTKSGTYTIELAFGH